MMNTAAGDSDLPPPPLYDVERALQCSNSRLLQTRRLFLAAASSLLKPSTTSSLSLSNGGLPSDELVGRLNQVNSLHNFIAVSSLDAHDDAEGNPITTLSKRCRHDPGLQRAEKPHGLKGLFIAQEQNHEEESSHQLLKASPAQKLPPKKRRANVAFSQTNHRNSCHCEEADSETQAEIMITRDHPAETVPSSKPFGTKSFQLKSSSPRETRMKSKQNTDTEPFSTRTKSDQQRAEAEPKSSRTKSSQQRWEHMFLRLLVYKALHGDCMVPRDYQHDPELYRWACYQRKKVAKLSSERKRLLEQVGFPLCLVKRDSWQVMFEQLAEYKQRHGDCLVPQLYLENKKLGKWVAVQRAFRHNLTKERMQLLESVGFEWSANEALWRSMYQSLVRFKATHGHCRVPYNYKADSSLANWVRRQRRILQSLSSDRLELLRKIGFDAPEK